MLSLLHFSYQRLLWPMHSHRCGRYKSDFTYYCFRSVLSPYMNALVDGVARRGRATKFTTKTFHVAVLPLSL